MEFWVFGYGSLMWRPDFPFIECHPALLEGAHRSLCVYSAIHRGTFTAPGLVLGLDKGGSCRGMAFLVPAASAQDTRLYLRQRESATNTYTPLMKPVKLLDDQSRTVLALCFIVNRHHAQYAGDLPLTRQAHLVRRSRGASGANIDYVVNTVCQLRALGVRDERLERLMAVLGYSASRDAVRAENHL